MARTNLGNEQVQREEVQGGREARAEEGPPLVKGILGQGQGTRWQAFTQQAYRL